MTVGIYRPIRLLSYTARIANLNPVALVTGDLDCSLAVRATLRGDVNAITTTQVILRDAKNNSILQHKLALKTSSTGTDEEKLLFKWTFDKDEVKLWWPTGYGDQALYVVEVTLLGEVCSIRV